MCLAIPGLIRECTGAVGKVDFGGIQREVRLDFLPEAQVGDYVLVHVGVAISKIDPDEAQRTLELLRQLGIDEVH